ncbi:MAG: M18 family aminopeptidase [Clostridiales bacterium]|nr:M18 family aminopeptidase [Clostridiales bacterium]
MADHVQLFCDFIQKSPSAFHACQTLCEMLDAGGYAPLSENQAWTLVPGGKYYVTRNRSSVIAFAIPQTGFAHFQIVSSHSDSPTFKLKHSCEDESGSYLRLNVERYGGMIMSTWFDRPLSIAGRVLVREGNALHTRLVDLGRDAVLIPNMPIHFNREINDGFKYNAQVDLLPLYGGKDCKGMLRAQIARAAGVTAEDIVSQDLFLYARQPGSVWGAKNEFFSCPRIDDLECAYTSAAAFLQSEAVGHINVLAVFDNEEVGSSSKQGADSTFLSDVFARVGAALGATDSEIRAAIASSFMASADNAHAVHPNHPEKYDAQNRTFMNGGVVIKHNANQKYTTDAVSCAIFSALCEKAGVPVQHFANRSDVLGGSTLGNIANTHTSMNTVDIGLAQLAMHSCVETAGCADAEYMVRALTSLYSHNVVIGADGDIVIE